MYQNPGLHNTWIGAGVSTHRGLPSGGGREPVREPFQDGAGESAKPCSSERDVSSAVFGDQCRDSAQSTVLSLRHWERSLDLQGVPCSLSAALLAGGRSTVPPMEHFSEFLCLHQPTSMLSSRSLTRPRGRWATWEHISSEAEASRTGARPSCWEMKCD